MPAKQHHCLPVGRRPDQGSFSMALKRGKQAVQMQNSVILWKAIMMS